MLIVILEILGTIAFAVSGAMVGIRRGMDVFGVTVLGVVTAVGGGMVRDVTMNKVPAALTSPHYVVMAIVTSLIVFTVAFFRKRLPEMRAKQFYDVLMLLMDSLGLGIFTVMGVRAGFEAGYAYNSFLLAFLGVITAVGGGLLRDMMAGVPPYIFVKHVYACASVAGAVLCVFLYHAVGQDAALIFPAILVFLIRILAAWFRWNLPRVESFD
jgi:uncharacterized membrane protein YeiH